MHYIPVRARLRGLSNWGRHGTINFLDAPEPVLAFTRELGGEKLLCVFNLGEGDVTWSSPVATAQMLYGVGAVRADNLSELPVCGGYIASI